MILLVRLVFGVIIVTYPFVVYFGLLHFEPVMIALLVLIIALVRCLLLARQKAKLLNIGFAGSCVLMAFAIMALLLEQSMWLKLYPVAISVLLFSAFAATLRTEKSMIQRFAELRETDISINQQQYMRNLTLVWCGFFVFNALVSAYSMFYTSDKIWALYNGLISYLLIGALIVFELIYRHLVVLRR